MADEKKPAGALPKNLQVWGVIAISALLLGVIIFAPTSTPTKKTGLDDKQAAELSQLGNSIQQSAAALREAQERAQQEAMMAQRQAQLDAANAPPPPEPLPATEQDELEKERRKREYQAQFASNVALTFRNGTPTRPNSPSSSSSASPSDENPDNDPDSPEAAIRDIRLQLQLQQRAEELRAADNAPKPQPTTPPKRLTTGLNNQRPGAPLHTVFEGSVIEAALVTRLSGDFSGPVLATTTAPHYSRNRRALLMPTGTKLIGEATRVADQNQERLAVAFHRAIMPDGYSVDLDQFVGLDGLGETALRDKVNHHYLRTFGTSIALGLLGGLSALTSDQSGYGLPQTSMDRYQQGFGASMGQQANQFLTSHTNVLPTITIREGHRVRIFVAQDFTLPAYTDHAMNPAL